MSGAEIEELDRFLLDATGIEESIDIATLDGVLTAIVCGRKMIMPSEWMRWVWDMEHGEDAAEFAIQARAQRILEPPIPSIHRKSSGAACGGAGWERDPSLHCV